MLRFITVDVITELAVGDDDDKFVVEDKFVVLADATFPFESPKHRRQHSNRLEKFRIEFVRKPLCHHAYIIGLSNEFRKPRMASGLAMATFKASQKPGLLS